MPIRTRYSLGVTISSNHSEERDLGNANYQVVTDQKTMGGGWKTIVTAGSTNLQLRMDNLANVQLLVIRINSQNPTLPPNAISVMLNSTASTPIVIQPLGDCREGHMLLSTTGLTALYATNSGTTDMEVSLYVSGD